MSIIDPMTRPTIMDVARKCGVSKTTVSVILNDSPASSRVPKETQQRVRTIADALGYHPNWRARALANRRTHMIGVLYAPPMPLVVRGNYEGILAGIHEVLAEKHYHMLLVPLGVNTESWSQILQDQRMDGCLVLSRLRDPLTALIRERKLLFTLINADSDLDVPTVLVDDFGGAVTITEHLRSLGHQRITFLMGDQPKPAHYSVVQRREGYASVLRRDGLERYVNVFEGELPDFVRQLRDTPPAQRPTAVLCYTHYLATKLLQKLWEVRLRVPQDLSVAGFGNAYPVEDTIPPLTTMALPTEQMGRSAAEMILEQVESSGAAAAKRVVLTETLIVRQSTAAPSAAAISAAAPSAVAPSAAAPSAAAIQQPHHESDSVT